MKEHIYRELAKIEKKERQLFAASTTPERDFFNKKIEAKIPPGLHKKLNHIFYRGFELIFSKGTGIIEKTYNKDQCREEHIINDFAFDTIKGKRSMRRLNALNRRRQLQNLGIAAGEGTGLGLLGIGLPDIPLFISLLLKAVYQIAVSYGFSYEREEEKFYILLLIEGAMEKGKKKRLLNARIDQTAAKIDADCDFYYDFQLQTQVTAAALADNLLFWKFLQGLPLIGAMGGVTNVYFCNKVSQFAKLKYKKRYLRKKL